MVDGQQNTRVPFWILLKKQFIAGFIVILPVALTVFIISLILSFINSSLGLGAFGFVILLVLIWLVGIISTSAVGKRAISAVKRTFMITPVFGGMFRGIEEVTDKVFAGDNRAFQDVVLVEYPKKDVHAIGFVSSGDVAKFKNKKLLPVFIPTTPNPTSGAMVFVPQDKITRLDISVKQGMETIISMGFLHPPEYRTKKL